MSRESHKSVLPLYYENALKVKYTCDMESAEMIDIIHDSLGNSFALAWHSALNGFLSGVIHASAMSKDSFASKYASAEKGMQSQLDKLIEKYEGNNG